MEGRAWVHDRRQSDLDSYPQRGSAGSLRVRWVLSHVGAQGTCLPRERPRCIHPHLLPSSRKAWRSVLCLLRNYSQGVPDAFTAQHLTSRGLLQKMTQKHLRLLMLFHSWPFPSVRLHKKMTLVSCHHPCEQRKATCIKLVVGCAQSWRANDGNDLPACEIYRIVHKNFATCLTKDAKDYSTLFHSPGEGIFTFALNFKKPVN